MKLGLYSDPHISQTSSILTGREGSFSKRLDNIINSFKWMNNFFKENKVDAIVCLGDVTDKPNLTAEEITALDACNLQDHYLILGNHCRLDKEGNFNSISLFKNVYTTPQFLFDDVFVLPYSREIYDIESITPRPKIILSHNDLYGYDFGGHKSEEGYKASSILKSCDLFVNGHLHNGGWISKGRIMNLGMLTGMNFSSCGGDWEPSVAIVDTETCEINLYENPVAFRFKKESFDTLPQLKKYLDSLPTTSYVLQVKVPHRISKTVRELLDQSKKVVAARVLVVNDEKDKPKEKVELVVDKSSIYDKLRQFIKEENPSHNLAIINDIINQLEESDK